MGWIKNIKLAWKHRKTIKAASKAADKIRRSAMKDGIKTTEFWGKTLVQILTVVVSLKPETGLDPEMGVAIVAGIEAIYNLVRGVVKAFAKK